MPILAFLIVFPIVVMALMLAIKNQAVRGWVVRISVLLIAAASIALTALNLGNAGPLMIAVHIGWIDIVMTAILVLISVYIIVAGIRDKKYGAVVLAVVQIVGTIWAEMTFGGNAEAEHTLMVDNLALIMVLLVGIVGGLICLFAVRYIEKYHHHKQMKDKSAIFFAAIFAFMSAMFGLVLANGLVWLLFFWEITTFCSFVLIGYTRTAESIRNAYRALVMNMVGGLVFLAGILWLFETYGVVELDKLLGLNPAAALIPVVFISFAGIVKAALMPFSSWLLGAMVAPTPVSALLHSSTMVKAGVYIVIRLSPSLDGTMAGTAIAFIGAVTFLLASMIAISTHNVKRLLAYSTISTLGLIVACAGVGTHQAVWTAILLMIFHAIAKSLLFLCAGTVEHGIDSQNIESMDGLITRMPKVATFMLIGIAGMFVAPFGMLISKWAALQALIEANPIITFFLAFGSATTLFFYTKWMGKLIMIARPSESQEKFVSRGQWFTLGTLSVLTVVVCLLLPLVSSRFIDPFIHSVYQQSASMATSNIIIMIIMMILILVMPLQLVFQRKDQKRLNAYLCGANIADRDPYKINNRFVTAMQNVEEIKLQNYYLENYFGEDRLSKIGLIITVALLAVMFGVTLL